MGFCEKQYAEGMRRARRFVEKTGCLQTGALRNEIITVAPLVGLIGLLAVASLAATFIFALPFAVVSNVIAVSTFAGSAGITAVCFSKDFGYNDYMRAAAGKKPYFKSAYKTASANPDCAPYRPPHSIDTAVVLKEDVALAPKVKFKSSRASFDGVPQAPAPRQQPSTAAPQRQDRQP